MKHLISLLLAVVLSSNLSLSLQEQALPSKVGNQSEISVLTSSIANSTQSTNPNNNNDGKIAKPYQDSLYYVPNYDPEMKSLPDIQLEFIRTAMAKDMDFYRTILREAIDKRNNLAPSVALMFKYSGKLLSNFIHNRQTEQRLSQRKDINPSFFEMLAKLSESIIDRSSLLKKEKGYSKKNVDVNELYRRVDDVFKYVQRIMDASPVAMYVQWDQVTLFKGNLTNPNHDKPVVEEGADLLAVSTESI